eukprot:NODE_35_length_36362_cov_0.944434.p3 type:complete len:647 gc:universal NODE_35_length_36362_cov_0.944434:21361-23301(+)
MNQLKEAFSNKDINLLLKRCKLVLNSSGNDAKDLNSLGVEIWNSAVKLQLDKRYKICAFILMAAYFKDSYDFKSSIKLIAMAGRLLAESEKTDCDYIYGLVSNRIDQTLGMLKAKNKYQKFVADIVPILLYKLKQGWFENDLSISILHIEKFMLVQTSKIEKEQLLMCILNLYRSDQPTDETQLTLLSLLENLANASDNPFAAKYYLIISEVNLKLNKIEEAKCALIKSSEAQIMLKGIFLALTIPNFLNTSPETFLFECLSKIGIVHETYNDVALLYNEVCKISNELALAYLTAVFSRSRAHPAKCKDLTNKTASLMLECLIGNEDTKQINIFIEDIFETINDAKLSNSICILLWIKGDDCLSNFEYQNALNYFEPSLRLLKPEQDNYLILKKKICFCKLQLGALDSSDILDDPFLSFQYNLLFSISNCFGLIESMEDPNVLIGCASLAFQKKESKLLLCILDKIHTVCSKGDLDICLTRAAIRLAIKVDLNIELIISILKKADNQLDKEEMNWFYNVTWNLCLQIYQIDQISAFRLLEINVNFAATTDLRINSLLFMCSIGYEIFEQYNVDHILTDIDNACNLIAENNLTDLIETSAKMQLEIYMLFQKEQEALDLLPCFKSLQPGILVEVLENSCISIKCNFI